MLTLMMHTSKVGDSYLTSAMRYGTAPLLRRLKQLSDFSISEPNPSRETIVAVATFALEES